MNGDMNLISISYSLFLIHLIFFSFCKTVILFTLVCPWFTFIICGVARLGSSPFILSAVDLHFRYFEFMGMQN